MQLARSTTANRGRGGKKTAYNKYRLHTAELQGFITDAAGQKDGWDLAKS